MNINLLTRYSEQTGSTAMQSRAVCLSEDVRELEKKYKEAIEALITSMGVMDAIEEYLTGSEKLEPYRQKMIGIIEKAYDRPWKEIKENL